MIRPLALALLSAGCLADIRPDIIEAAADDQAAADRGRALLEAAAEAHGGLAAWNARQSLTFDYSDEWMGFTKIMSPWPKGAEAMHHELLLHTFDSRVRFEGGKADGVHWGIQDWTTWHAEPGEAGTLKSNKDARFMLPTMHYFVEFPYRILEAPVVLDAGEVELNGKTYASVFATWDSTEPSKHWDQYIVYIDPDTGLVAKTSYTVREIAGFITGTMHFEDFRQVDGAWLPHRMVVNDGPDKPYDKPVHEVIVNSYAFDTVATGDLQLP